MITMNDIDRPPQTERRGPRWLTSPARDAQPTDVDEADGVWECQRQARAYAAVEKLVELVTHFGIDPRQPYLVFNGEHIKVAEPIATVQKWCQDCPFQGGCYTKMTTGTRGYTGIAGGVILHHSQPYQPRRERNANIDEEGTQDGLW